MTERTMNALLDAADWQGHEMTGHPDGGQRADDAEGGAVMHGELRNASVGVLASWQGDTPLSWFAGLADGLARVKELNGLAGEVLLAHLHAGRNHPLIYLRLVKVGRPLTELLEDLESVIVALFEEQGS